MPTKSTKKKQAQAPKGRVILVTYHHFNDHGGKEPDTMEAHTTITGFCKQHPEHKQATINYWIMRRKEKYATQDVTVERIPLHRNKH